MKNKLINDLNNSDNESIRLYAAQDIADTKDPELVLPMIKRLEIETSQIVREAIVFGLENMPCDDIFEELFKLFFSTDAYLRNAAVSIFSHQKDEPITFLVLKMDNTDREVRKLIIDALFGIGTQDSCIAIRAALNDPAINVKITAVEYLGRLEDKESADELIALFENESEPMLRASILEALLIIGTNEHLNKIISITAPDCDFAAIDFSYLGNSKMGCKNF
ncbi:MAG: HEAT repeat domain-containing protein [Desulfobacterales bacterium]|nr:HEAT repeat domain-containing protein [Desulfobacterales bacterium]